jgi:DNA-binding MarR family transcriptional regulator
MPGPTQLGEGFRGADGRVGYLLVQAYQAFATAMEAALHEGGNLSRAQFGTMSVIVREPGLSSADLARAVLVTPQAINQLVANLEASGLVERRTHPSHGRILQIHPTAEGIRRLEASYPVVTELEDRITAGLTERKVAEVKRWLVDTARAMRAATEP